MTDTYIIVTMISLFLGAFAVAGAGYLIFMRMTQRLRTQRDTEKLRAHNMRIHSLAKAIVAEEGEPRRVVGHLVVLDQGTGIWADVQDVLDHYIEEAEG